MTAPRIIAVPSNPGGTMTEGGRVETRGFHPAPLTIEPRQWLHIGFSNQ